MVPKKIDRQDQVSTDLGDSDADEAAEKLGATDTNGVNTTTEDNDTKTIDMGQEASEAISDSDTDDDVNTTTEDIDTKAVDSREETSEVMTDSEAVEADDALEATKTNTTATATEEKLKEKNDKG